MAILRIHHTHNPKGFFIMRLSDSVDMAYAKRRVAHALGLPEQATNGLARAGQLVPDQSPISDFHNQDLTI